MNLERYLAIPYREKGRGWDGADCYGFARLVMKEETGFEMPILDGRSYVHDSDFNLYDEIDLPENPSLVLLSGGPFGKAHVGIHYNGMIIQMSRNGVSCRNWNIFRKYVRGIYIPRGQKEREDSILT